MRRSERLKILLTAKPGRFRSPPSCSRRRPSKLNLSVRFSLGLQASSAFSLFDPLDPRTYVDIGRGQRRAQLIQNRNTRGKADGGKAEGVIFNEPAATE